MAVTPELIIDCYSYFWSHVPRFLVVLLHLRSSFIGIAKKSWPPVVLFSNVRARFMALGCFHSLGYSWGYS